MGALRLLGIGWYFATCIGLGLVIGIWVDDQSGHSPLFTLLGLFAGMAIGFVGMFRMVYSISNQNNKGTNDE